MEVTNGDIETDGVTINTGVLVNIKGVHQSVRSEGQSVFYRRVQGGILNS